MAICISSSRLRGLALLSSSLLLPLEAAKAQGTGDDPTVRALIDLLVERGTISRAEADTLVKAAQARAPADPSEHAVSPPKPPSPVTRDLEVKAPPPFAKQEEEGTPDPSTASPYPSRLVVKAAQSNALTVDWSEGDPKFTSPGGFSFRPRGRIIVDGQMTSGSRYADRNISTTGARAARLGFEGTYGNDLFYQFEADFADAATEVTSAYFGWRRKLSPKVTTELNVGSRLTERGIDGSTGSDQTPLMERNAVTIALVPLKGFFGLGFTSKTFGPNWHVAVSLVGEPINSSSASGDSKTIIARGHWNPVKTDNALIHLGAWGYHEDFSSSVENLTINVRKANRYNDNVRVFAGPLPDPRGSEAFGLEAGGTYKGFWAFAEYGQRRVRFRQSAGLADVTLKASSVSAGWVLTGEKAPFAQRAGSFTMLDVANPVFEGGPGAIEVVARYERTDYRDAPLGGSGDAWTAGVNWYFNDISRMMVNYIRFRTDNRAGDYIGPDTGDIVATRFQISF